MATATGTVTLAKVAREKITRFDVHQIVQHAAMMVSFTLLVLTGLPLKFHDVALSQWWVGLWGGIEATRIVHRAAAWTMVVDCFYHLGYLWYTITILKRPFPIKMVPSASDFVNLVQELAYCLGLRKHPPRFDRFNWREKFDYWAIFWGMPVMAGSGFVLMFPVFVTSFLPGWIVPAAMAAHSDEAMLALTWIALIHIFFNHFAPGIFPINTSIFTGKVTKERYVREHPLEYERLIETDSEVKVE